MNEDEQNPSYQAYTPPPVIPLTQEQIPTVAPGSSAFSFISALRHEVKKVFIGQDEVIDQVLAAFLAGGHVLLEGKPGLGKTHLVLAVSKACGIEFGRIQFTPDLMPSDVTGHTLYDMARQEFRVRKGPVFTNLLLADEINRAPAKTQSSLLEVMQELQVTIDGDTMPLTPPFMTIATQNPIEQEGTYPLPEAQLDRFLMKVLIDYPNAHDESVIVARVAGQMASAGLKSDSVEQVCNASDIMAAQKAATEVQAVQAVIDYAVNLVRATRETAGISLGAGTRGAISLLRAGKAYAVLAGRSFVSPDDIKRAVLPVLRHRVAIAPELAISGQDVDSSLRSIIESVVAPR